MQGSSSEELRLQKDRSSAGQAPPPHQGSFCLRVEQRYPWRLHLAESSSGEEGQACHSPRVLSCAASLLSIYILPGEPLHSLPNWVAAGSPPESGMEGPEIELPGMPEAGG